MATNEPKKAKQGKRISVLDIFVAWCAALALIWAISVFSEPNKALLSIIGSIAFVMIGFFYFRWNQINPKLTTFIERVQNTNLEPFIFGFSLTLSLIESLTAFYSSIVTWQVFEVNGVQVLTYINLINIAIFVMGFYLLIFAVRIIKRRIKKKKDKEKEIMDKIKAQGEISNFLNGY